MYKIIILDDEESIRNRLVQMIRKIGDDFEVVGLFENGFDALESGISLNPDIIISDIRMSYVSGIEFVKQAKIELPLVRSIFISGYDSFDYAKEAISLGASGYLTKPIVFEELKEVLYSVKNSLDSQLLSSKNLKSLEEKVQSSIRILQSEDLNKLITLKSVPSNFADKLKEDQIDLSLNYQITLIFDSDSDSLLYDEQDILQLSVQKIFANDFSLNTYYSFFRDDRFVVILICDERIDVQEITFKLNEMIAQLKRTQNISLSIGISNIFEGGIKEINYRKMYRHALRALEYRTALGNESILYFTDLEKEDLNKMVKIDENEYKQISYLISYGKTEDVSEKITQIVEQISVSVHQDNYYFILTNLMETIIKCCLSLPDFYNTFDSQIEITNHLYSLKSKESVISYLDEIVKAVVSINESKKISGIEGSYLRIYKYLEVHYSNPNLSIDDVAQELCYSISYISAILKKNNTTFTKITTDLRMKKALELLINDDNRIIMIAKEVGYSDPYYFSHCFKKYTGLSPDEYRKEKKNS